MNVIAAAKQIMVDAGITTPIKLAKQPDTPSEVITIIDTGGTTPDVDISALHFPTFQVLVRAGTYTAGKAIVDDVRSALHGKIAVEAAGVHFLRCHLIAEPGSIGENGRGEHEFTANFTAEVRSA